MSAPISPVVWAQLYVALALLPLGVAWLLDPFDAPRGRLVEASVAAGLIAYGLLVFQFALVSRLGPVSRSVAVDNLMQFHRQMGIAALLFALAHPLLLTGRGVAAAAWSPFSGSVLSQSGAVALWAAVLVVVTSVARRRLRLSYEAWQGLHLLLSIAIVAAMLLHVLAARRYASAPLMEGLLIAYALVFLALMVRYRLVRPLLLWRQPWEVVENRDVGGSTRLLTLRPLDREMLQFEPGQFCWLLTGRTPLWFPQHPISMASSAESRADGMLEFAIKALGDWSRNSVPDIAPGRRLWVDGPFGAFVPQRHAAQGFVLIAGGIGISPMRSVLQTMRDREDQRPIVLFYAAHDWSRVVFRDELAELTRHLNLQVVYVFESPVDGWQGERGYVTPEVLGRHLPRAAQHFQYFICGPVAMMDAVERGLLTLGVPGRRIHTERFDMM
jgi:predicted ferric reductase